MIASLMAYCLAVTALISLAAWVIDRAIASSGLPRRGVWIAALIASLIFPTFMMVTTKAPAVSVISLVNSPEPTGSVLLPAAPKAESVSIRSYLSSLHLPDTSLRALWIAASAGLLSVYLIGWARLQQSKKHWPIEQVAGVSVRVTDNVGPAVFGFVKPEIILPRWLLAAPATTRTMVMAHERAHITARDPWLLLLALLIVALAPWNLPLWWQLRRLRFAIEVDCDARVLRSNTDVSTYGEMLLSVGQHKSRAPMGAIALTEPMSQLEQRIRIMTRGTYRYAKLLILASIAMSVSIAVVAAQIEAPALRSTSMPAALTPALLASVSAADPIAYGANDTAAASAQVKTTATRTQPVLKLAASAAPNTSAPLPGATPMTGAVIETKENTMTGSDFKGKRLNLNFKDADIRDVLTSLARATGQNIYMSGKLGGKISIEVHDTSPDEALDIFLRSAGLVKRQEGNMLIIDPAPTAPASATNADITTFDYKGERLNLRFRDIETREVLQLIASASGQNMIVSDNVGGTITLDLQSVPWDQALDTVLRMKNLVKHQEGNVIIVEQAAR